MRTHPFYAGDHFTHDGRRICEFCGDVERAKVHEMPETPEEARLVDARMLGEGYEERD